MTQEVRQCQSCKNQFVIEPDDFGFYETIKVPPPTFCFYCQLRQRLSFRNERTLYKRKCDVPGHTEELISIYSPSKKITVYDHQYWWSDEWDAMRLEIGYDFSKTFFEQFSVLVKEIPWVALINFNSVNSDYCNFTTDNKNCYLVFGGDFNEDCLYSTFNFHSKSSSDMYFTDKCELCYEVIDTNNCYKVFFSRYANDCTDSLFLYDCVGCANCIGCTNLRNKSYYIFNKPYSKEEYKEKLKEFDFASYAGLRKIEKDFNVLKLNTPRRYARILKSTNSTGDNVVECKNVLNGFDIKGPAEDLKNIFLAGWGLKDSHSCNHLGHRSQLVYNSFAVFSGCSNVRFSILISSSHDIEYSYNCRNCHDLFGCVGLKNKQYCILNKQYTKEEYENIVPKIREHMKANPYKDKKGMVYAYGEFFPTELSLFAYNETIAQEYFPMSPEKIIAEGLMFENPSKRYHEPTLSPGVIPDSIGNTKDDISRETVGCEHEGGCQENCTNAFLITVAELTLYRQLKLPIPHLCPNCRHYKRLRARNPLKLWPRKCQCVGTKSENDAYTNTISHAHGAECCPNEFETPYAPDRPEIVYCEQCYNAEVV